MKIFNPNNILLEENAYIVLTHLCNRNCPFCIDIYRNKSKDYLSLEKLKEINIILQKNEIKRVTLVGGEPLLNPEIEEICLFLSKYYDLVITTNFDYEDGSILKKITLHDCFKVFLDKEKGYRFEINEKLLNHLGFSLEFEVINFHRLANLEEYDFENDEIEITKKEFVNTLIDNYEIFKKAKMNDGRYWNYPVENYFCYKRKI